MNKGYNNSNNSNNDDITGSNQNAEKLMEHEGDWCLF